MEQGVILQHQLPLPSEYPLASEHDSIGQFPAHPRHPAYTNGSAVDQLRREGTLPHQGLTPFTFTAANAHGARFLPDGGIASDASSYRTGNNFTDSGSGSISTSPSSATSSLVYNGYPASTYTSLPGYHSTVQHPHSFLPSSYAGTRVAPPILDGTTSVAPLNPRRSLISSTTNAGDRESYAHSTPYLARNQHPPNGFGVYTDTPRSIHSLTGLSLSSGYPAHMASASPQSGFEGSQNECANFPWPSLEVLSDIECEGQAVTPEIHAKVEKGFFKSTVDQKWTCYRRNYFSVACHFTIHPNVYNGRMWLKRNNTREQIQAMGMRLSAAVDGPGGKNIELVQHTPKRDNGPKSKIEVIKVSPTSSSGRGEHSISPNGIYQVQMSAFHATGQVLGPYLPFQQSNESDAPSSSSPQSSQAYQYGAGGSHLGVPGQTTTHTFERVQFKQATANNGKRRASQQYFHLMVELFADVRKDGKEQPVWVKVAHKLSDKIVVRGRSPSHYQNEGQHNQGGRNGGAGGGGGYSTSTGVAYGGLNTGGFRSSASAYGGTIGNSGGYRANQYGHQNSSGDDASSPESVDDRAMESDHPIDTVMSDADRAGVQDYEGYQYYPHPIYEEVQQHLLPLPKIETGARYSTEPRQYAVKAEYADAAPGTHWPIGGVGRFQGVDSSRGYYPDLSAGAPGFP